MRRFVASLLAIIASASANASTFEAQRPEFQHLLAQYNAALTSGDVDSILRLNSQEPVFMPEYAPAAAGRAAVRKAYEWVFATLKLNGQFHLHEGEVLGDRAWIRTSSSGRFTVIATGVEADVANNEFFLFRREHGSWKIHRYMFTSAVPPRGD